MSIYTDSRILAFFARIWNWFAEYFSTGLLARFFRRLAEYFRSSLIYRLLTARDRLAQVWQRSLFYRALHWVINLLPNLLSRLHEKSPDILEESLCFRLLERLGRHTLTLAGVMILAMLCIPQELWNNLYSLIMIVAITLVFCISCTRDRSRRLSFEFIGPWPVMFFFISALSLLWSQSFSLSFRFLFFLLTCVMFMLTCVSATDSEKQLYRFVSLCAVGLGICCLYALFQRYVGVEASESFTDLDANANMPGRVFSFFENPNAFANLLVFFSPLMLSMAIFSKKNIQKIGFATVFLLCVLALVMTYSRGGWLAFAFAIFIFMMIMCPRWVPLCIILACIALPFLPSTILDRILSIFSSDSSISSRGYIYSAMVQLIGKNWLIGVGLGITALKRGIGFFETYHATFPFVHAHNIYMEIWGESGIFALIAFVLAMFFALRRGGSAARKKDNPLLLRGIAAGAVSGIAGALIFGITDYAWIYPRVMVFFWCVVTIMLCAAKLSEKEGIING